MDIKKIEQADFVRMSSFNKVSSDNGFRQVFDRELSEVNKIASPALSNHETDVMNHSDKVLDLLDDYANELNNPLKTLRDIEPIISNIEKEMQIVEAKTADIAPANEEIDQMIKALSVTAHVAVMKFQRGDYL